MTTLRKRLVKIGAKIVRHGLFPAESSRGT